MKLLPRHIAVVFSLFCLIAGRAQLRLTENKGQWDNRVLYQADLRSTKLFVAKGELTYLFYNAQTIYRYQHNAVFDSALDVHVIKVQFENANPAATYSAQNPYSDYANYFHGNDPKHWASRVGIYSKLYVKDIYPSVDFELYEDKGTLKYNFIVNPGGDPSAIKMRYLGADDIYLDGQELVIRNSMGAVTEQKPLVFQGPESDQQLVPASYELNGNVLSFNISNKRNKRQAMVIDPVLVFSTYSGSAADNFGYTATFDTAGNGYAGGTVFGFGYPTTAGAFQVNFAGGSTELPAIGYIDRDCGITKYSKDGKRLLYSTYLGGSLSNEQPHSMIVNSKNQLLVMGSTKSIDFPMGIGASFDNTQNGKSDIFIARFSIDGTQLLSATYVGGFDFDGLNGDRPTMPNQGNPSGLLYNYADDFRGEIVVDSNDNVYVATTTNSFDFPVPGGFDVTHGGKQDGCVFALTADLSSMLFGSFIGGSDNDAAYGLDFGTHHDLYVTGGSISTTFGYNAPGMSRTSAGGRADGYLLRMDLNSLGLMACTFIGTGGYDQCYFVKTDKYGKPFVYGQTDGSMNASAGVYTNAGGKMFIKKLALNCTSVELETVFGGPGKFKPDLSPTAFLVDECERIFISGWGCHVFAEGFSGGGTTNLPVTKDAYQKTTDGYDFYLAVFSKNLIELQYASFFGGASDRNNAVYEHVDGGTSRFNKKGIVYQSVCAGCGAQSLFPATKGVWSEKNKSNNCNNALFKFDFENLNRKPIVKDSIYSVLATDSIDFTADISDPDLTDSLKVVLQSDIFKDPNFPKPLPKILSVTKLSGAGNTIRVRVKWNPNCNHVGLDTVKLYLKVYDQGCPTNDSNSAVIRIVVKAPPLTVTPETFCLNFKDNGQIRLSWKEFPKNAFFERVMLYRINPNGTLKTLDTIRSTSAGAFEDITPQDAKTVNYIYYMVGYNICNKPYDAGVRVNTTKEFNTPIDSTYMHYVTVVGNRNISVNWFRSKEEDFGSYDIFRADNIANVSQGYRKIKSVYDLTDTSYTDENVNVQEKSYCYRIGVNDKCGHVSRPSNEGCNIVLSGKAGHLFFDVNWSPYRTWYGGVQDYQLYRRVDTGEMRPFVNTSLLRVYHDDEMDLWWGAYYYVVRGFEGFNHGLGYHATSLSNEIRLIQPPLVFVPNAFSPNGDGFNDVWGVSHAFVKDFQMQVYNRWGEKVWQNDFKGNQWDGVTRGQLAMNDVFVWIVTYRGWDNKFYTQKGTVTVMP